MDEIKRLKTLIDNGDDITENYKKIEKLISIEYSRIKTIKKQLNEEIQDKEMCSNKDFDLRVRDFLNNNDIDENTMNNYSKLLKGFNYLMDKNDKEVVKLKKLTYTSNKKLKIKNIS